MSTWISDTDSEPNLVNVYLQFHWSPSERLLCRFMKEHSWSNPWLCSQSLGIQKVCKPNITSAIFYCDGFQLLNFTDTSSSTMREQYSLPILAFERAATGTTLICVAKLLFAAIMPAICSNPLNGNLWQKQKCSWTHTCTHMHWDKKTNEFCPLWLPG